MLFYEAAAHLILYLTRRAQASGKSQAAVFESFPFLQAYHEQLRDRFPEIIDTPGLVKTLRDACETWENSSAQWLPLAAAKAQAELSHEALVCLVLTGLVEEDSHFGELFASLQPPSGNRRPLASLLQAVLKTGNGSDLWASVFRFSMQGFSSVPIGWPAIRLGDAGPQFSLGGHSRGPIQEPIPESATSLPAISVPR